MIVYHHTSPRSAKIIRKTGRLTSAGEPHVYVTTWPYPDTGYGQSVVALDIPKSKLEIDDEFPSGRQDFRISVGKPGGSIKVTVIKNNPAKPLPPEQTVDRMIDLHGSLGNAKWFAYEAWMDAKRDKRKTAERYWKKVVDIFTQRIKRGDRG